MRQAVAALAAAMVAYAALLMTPLAAAAAKPLKLVAFGDSLTAGYGLPADAAFPAMLEEALKARGHDVTIANAGVSGDTTTGGLERLDWSIPDGTDGVILELGANDVLRGVDPGVAEKNLDAMLAKLKARHIPVLIAGMYAARSMGTDYVKRFDAIYPELAKRYDAPLYPFFLDGVQGDRALVQPDGLHPTAKGVQILVDRFLPTAESFVRRIAGES